MLNATVVKRIDITPDLFILQVKPDAGVPAFHAGQYVALGLVEGAQKSNSPAASPDASAPGKLIKRAYSIGSSPVNREYLEFYIAIVRDGTLTPALDELHEGDRLYAAPKITGTFVVDNVPPTNNLVFLSTGTGIAPFMAMLRTPSVWTAERKITVVHGVRFSSDLAYRDELLRLSDQDPRLSYIPIVSRTDPAWSGKIGRVQRLFEDGTITLDPVRDNVFMCGNPAMIDEMEVLLLGKGYTVHSKKNPSGMLHVEKYW